MSIGRTFLVSASTLMSGTLFAQAITFALSLLLTRLYDPGEFGRYSIFVGVAGVLGAMSTGALDRIVLLGRTRSEARRAATTVFLLTVGLAGVVALVGGLLWSLGLDRSLPLHGVDLAILAPLFMIGFAAAQVFTYSCLREGRVRTLAALKVGQSATMGLVQLALSWFHSLPGLILGSIAGWIVLAASGMRWRLAQGFLLRDLRPVAVGALIRRHWRYPRYVLPNEILDGLSNQAPVFLVGTFVTLSAAGQYGLAIMVLSAPSALVGQAVGQAFLQHMGPHENDPRTLEQAVWRIWLGLAGAGLIPFGVLLIFGPELFSFGFGGRWLQAGIIAQHIAPLLLLRFTSSPTSTLYWKLKMQREQWWFSLAAACYRPLCYGLTVFGFSLNFVIVLHVAIESLAIILFNVFTLRRLRDLQRVAA